MGDKLNSHILDFGLQTANAAAGAGMGLLLQKGQDKRQLKQQKKLNALQIEGNKQMMDYGYGKQMQMWQDTNYGAQMKQLTEAGLNPGMLYGMSGGGGTTTGSPQGNVSGAHAPTGGGEAITMAQTAASMGLMRAQKENIEADTANKKADTSVKDTTVPKLKAETDSITQGIENQKAAKELMDIQVGIQSVEEHIAKMTQNQAVAKIGTELRYVTAQMHIWERNNNIDAATADEKIELMEQQVIETGARILLTKAQTGKTSSEIGQIATNIKATLQQIQNETDKVAIQKKLQEFETSFGGQAAAVLQSLIGIIPGRGRKTTITHEGGARNETIHRRE